MLEHLRIIELGQVIAGTVGGMILADLGAEVIKVERPGGGDPGRRAAVYGMGERSAIHLTFNRNKKSIAIDLKRPEGREVLCDLVRHADAVVENFRPGVLTRLGVDFEQLRTYNEDLILVSVSGFGSDSPYGGLPAYDLIMQAMSGHMSIMGEPGRPPVIMGIPLADIVAGVYSTIAVLAGIEARRAGGGGAHFDMAMLDVMLAMLAHVGTLHLNTGREQEPQGSAHPFITPWQAFRCADDRYVVVAPREQHFWTRLVEVLGVPELSRPEYDDAISRHEHRGELLPTLEAAFEQKSADAWIELLRGAGVPVAPVNKMADIFSDPHTKQRQMVQAYELGGDEIRVVGNPVRLENEALAAPDPAPPVGADTDVVLGELLGYGDDAIAALRETGVVS